jgi:hypothetical protein
MKFQIFIKEYVFITSPQPSYLPVRQAGSRGGRTASPKYRIQPAGKVVFSPQSLPSEGWGLCVRVARPHAESPIPQSRKGETLRRRAFI